LHDHGKWTISGKVSRVNALIDQPDLES